MRIVSLLLVSLISAFPSSQQQPDIGGFIQGTALDAVDGQPIKDATLDLQLVGSQTARGARTNDQGAFVFNGVAPGQYELWAQAPSYLRQRYREVEPGMPGPNLAVQNGGRYNVPFRLIRASSVSGRIYDVERRPASGVAVELLNLRYDPRGGRTLAPINLAEPIKTNDQGEYRISGIQPGEFYLRVAPVTQPAERSRLAFLVSANSLATTYYPGVTSPDEAIPVKISAGSNLQAIDFSLAPLSPYKVTGRINNPFLKDANATYNYFLVRQDSKIRDGEGLVADQDPANDRFEFRNVRPGSYNFYVAFHTGPSPDDLFYSGRTPLDVVDRDVADLTVAIESGIDLSGEVRVDDSDAAPKLDMRRVQPTLMAAADMPGVLGPTAILARHPFVQPDGTFHIPHAARGKYRLLSPVGPPATGREFYLASARLGTQDILGREFEITDDTTGPLILELSRNGGTIEGTVTDKDHALVAGAQIMLVPPINLRDDQTSYGSALTNAQGRFTISGIRPGTYTAFAFAQRVDVRAVMNPEFMTPYLTNGVSVTLDVNQKVTRDFAVISGTR